MMEIEFKVDRVTKNTVKYEEVVEDGKEPVMGGAYVRKSVLKDLGVTNPEKATRLVLEIKEAS
jgi:hypothetical protein